MQTVLYQLFTAIVGSLGFSLIFNIGKKHIVPATLGGLLSWAVYLLCQQGFGMNLMVATIISAACCEVYAEILARLLKAPTTVFYIPAVVPLIPGGALYNTMYAAVFQDWAGCKSYGFQTLQATLGIAIGISFVSAVLHMLANLAHRRAARKG